MAKIKDPGFGYMSDRQAARMVNSDGSFNLHHVNKRFSISEAYTHLITITWWKFFLLVLLGYIIVNVLFAWIYYTIGIDQLSVASGTDLDNFINAFFFSTQTLTTLGYGTISPIGQGAGFVASFEALIGLLSFSLMTGLLYGRFSRPKAAIRFSEQMVLRPFNDKRAVMFRLMNKRKNVMIEPEIAVTMALTISENGKMKRQFFKLDLERDHITYLPTTWTIVHEIDESSPLKDYTDEEIVNLNAELFILVQYFEDAYAQRVYQLHSYGFEQLLNNRKFVPAYFYDEHGKAILDHSLLSRTSKIEG